MPELDTEYWFQQRDEADIVAQVAAKSVPERRARSGCDSAGCVEVTIDRDGVIINVLLATNWQARVANADSLAAAVIEATAAASATAFQEWAENYEAASKEPQPRPRPVPQWLDAGSPAIADPSADFDHFMRQMASMLDQVNTSLDIALAAGDKLMTSEATVRSRLGEVEASAGPNGSLTALRLDPRWAARTSPATIEKVIASTASAAQQSTLAAAATELSTISEAMAALEPYQDPRALFHMFGLL